MNDMNRTTSLPRHPLRPAAVLAAFALLLCALPAGAGLSGAIGAGGVGHSLKETLKETTDNFGEMVSAFIEGNDDRVSELAGEIKKTPGKLIKRAFPVFEAPQAIAGRLQSAKQKIKRFAGGVKEGLTDARTALATDGDKKDGGWSDASLLKGEPLQATTNTDFAASSLKPRTVSSTTLTGKPAQGAGAASADPAWDFEQWVIAKQEANPHCYGVVDPETLPAECFGGTSAESPVANRVEDAPQARASDWASGNWTVEGDGWSGWDKSDLRYSDTDREAARVGAFAVRCWGVYEVSKRHGLYELMRERMQRNECPNEETRLASSDDAGNEYANALADMFEDDSAKPADADYQSALSDLEAKEEATRERERLAPKCDEYRAAIKQFFTTQGKYAIAQYDGESFDQSSVNAAYGRLRNAATSVDVDFDSALSASQSVWYKEASGSSTAEARSKVWGAVDASSTTFVKNGGVCDS